ncbi:bile acid:sodium symporter family protein [Kiritimatiellaeota bacterium B1221]|nr:bile acid:sodium symporter family protein [Kiritimatiellaeota bacterium B1221]
MLKTVALPLALILIMIGMGMSLTPADFKRVIRKPKASILGLVLQLLLLPVIAFMLCVLFGLQGELAVGLMVVASCPGGATSNMISHLSKGDTALSVTLTAFSSLITPFTIPLIIGASLGYFLETDSTITLPFAKTLIQLLIVSVLPVCIGMILHKKFPVITRKLGKPVNIMSLAFLAIIVVIAVIQEQDLLHQFSIAGPVAFSLNVVTMSIGFALATLIGLGQRQRITLAIETGIQNGTLALAISLGMLESPRIAIPAVVYSLIMFISGGAMMIVFGPRATPGHS